MEEALRSRRGNHRTCSVEDVTGEAGMGLLDELPLLSGWEPYTTLQGISNGQPPMAATKVRTLFKYSGRGWFTFLEVLTNDPQTEVRLRADHQEQRLKAQIISSTGITNPTGGVPNVSAINKYIAGYESLGPLTEVSYFGQQAAIPFTTSFEVLLYTTLPGAVVANYQTGAVVITDLAAFLDSLYRLRLAPSAVMTPSGLVPGPVCDPKILEALR